MLPFVVAGTRPGLEVVHPMAVVVLGGLVTSTLLSLFVLPALYLRFGGRASRPVSPEEELMRALGRREPVARHGGRPSARRRVSRPRRQATGARGLRPARWLLAAAAARGMHRGGGRVGQPATSPSKLEPVKGTRPPARDLHGGGRRADRPPDGDGRARRRRAQGRPLRRAALRRRGQDLRLHEPASRSTYLREEVEVDRIEGTACCSPSGPPAGTEVVTVGAAEVYGAELEIASH